MKVKIGDLKLKDGSTTIRKLLDTCDYPWCFKCKYHGDTCDENIMNIEVEIPQTVKRGLWEYDKKRMEAVRQIKKNCCERKSKDDSSPCDRCMFSKDGCCELAGVLHSTETR